MVAHRLGAGRLRSGGCGRRGGGRRRRQRARGRRAAHPHHPHLLKGRRRGRRREARDHDADALDEGLPPSVGGKGVRRWGEVGGGGGTLRETSGALQLSCGKQRGVRAPAGRRRRLRTAPRTPGRGGAAHRGGTGCVSGNAASSPPGLRGAWRKRDGKSFWGCRTCSTPPVIAPDAIVFQGSSCAGARASARRWLIPLGAVSAGPPTHLFPHCHERAVEGGE